MFIYATRIKNVFILRRLLYLTMSQSAISSVISTVESFLTTLVSGVASFISSAIAELVNYAPQIVDIAVLGFIVSGIGYAIYAIVQKVPFVNNIFNMLGKLVGL